MNGENEEVQGPQGPIVCPGRVADQSNRRGSPLFARSPSAADSVLHSGKRKGEAEEG